MDCSDLYSWNILKAMPTKRVFATAVEDAGIIYIIGGCDSKGQPLDSFESYNPNKKQPWSRLANMPTKRAGVTALVCGQFIVAIGGVSQKQEPLDSVEVYDLKSKQWKCQSSMSDQLLGLSGVTRDQLVYVVGGMGLDTNPRDTFKSYDPERDQWTTLPSMPTPRYATSSFLIRNRLYVIGGRQGKLPTDAFEVFDFDTQTWEKLQDIPSKRVFPSYVSTETHIFSLGGLNSNPKDGFSNTTEVFSLENSTWTVGSNMHSKRGDFAAGALNGKVIVCGGLSNDGKPIAEAEIYDCSKDVWSKLPALPTTHCSCASIITKSDNSDYFHVIGGLTIGGASNAVEILSHR